MPSSHGKNSCDLLNLTPILTSYAIGVINTGLISGLGLGQRTFLAAVNRVSGTKAISVEEGVQNGLWAATGRKAEIANGGFYEPVGKVGVQNKASSDEELAKKLWEWTQTELAAWE